MPEAVLKIERRQPKSRSANEGADVAARVGALDWATIGADLDAYGAATTGALLTPGECADIVGLYGDESRFRSRVVMARHGFGRGEYKYLAYPLPRLVAGLRGALYPGLAAIANRWNAALGAAARFPPSHAAYLARCRRAGQGKPTPLILSYGPGDYNCLHRDLYGAEAFPLQATILLSSPSDFAGGEFLLTEQRPRMQSRAEVVTLAQGEAAIFPVMDRPVAGARGTSRVAMRHGVSRLKSGRRLTLGIIFHDAT